MFDFIMAATELKEEDFNNEGTLVKNFNRFFNGRSKLNEMRSRIFNSSNSLSMKLDLNNLNFQNFKDNSEFDIKANLLSKVQLLGVYIADIEHEFSNIWKVMKNIEEVYEVYVKIDNENVYCDFRGSDNTKKTITEKEFKNIINVVKYLNIEALVFQDCCFTQDILFEDLSNFNNIVISNCDFMGSLSFSDVNANLYLKNNNIKNILCTEGIGNVCSVINCHIMNYMWIQGAKKKVTLVNNVIDTCLTIVAKSEVYIDNCQVNGRVDMQYVSGKLHCDSVNVATTLKVKLKVGDILVYKGEDSIDKIINCWNVRDIIAKEDNIPFERFNRDLEIKNTGICVKGDISCKSNYCNISDIKLCKQYIEKDEVVYITHLNNEGYIIGCFVFVIRENKFIPLNIVK